MMLGKQYKIYFWNFQDFLILLVRGSTSHLTTELFTLNVILKILFLFVEMSTCYHFINNSMHPTREMSR